MPSTRDSDAADLEAAIAAGVRRSRLGGADGGGAFAAPQPDETDVMGRWIETRGGVRADDTCGRIDWLVNEVLEEVAVSPEWGAWEVLGSRSSSVLNWISHLPLPSVFMS
jgi:hypothetical protein